MAASYRQHIFTLIQINTNNNTPHFQALMIRPSFFYLLFYRFFFRNKLGPEDEIKITRKDMTHSVISIDSILLNSMRNGKIVILAASKETWLFAYYKRYKYENKGADKLCGNCTADSLFFLCGVHCCPGPLSV